MKDLLLWKRYIAAVLFAATAALLLAGCSGDGVAKAEAEVPPSASESPVPSAAGSPPSSADTPSDSSAPENGVGTPDFGAVRSSLPPDTVMMTVNGEQILWDELFFSIYAIMTNVISTFGELPAWDEQVRDGVTFKNYMDEAIYSEMVSGIAVKAGAQALGLSLTSDDIGQMEAQFADMEEQLGGAENLAEYLRGMYCTEELYRTIVETSYLQKRCFDELFGEGGEKASDSDLQRYADDSGYLMAKHILKLTENMETREPLPDDEIARAREESEAILAQLDGYDGADFEVFFDELMFENSEDTGLQGNPGGYLFGAGEMVPEFEEATRQLAVGSHSGIVETVFGFHIIYRLPIDYDATLGSGHTLRYEAALDMFNRTAMESWREGLSVTLSPSYESLDLEELFGDFGAR
ncbi:MAG: peptidylprolyl isomerase [Oscillospiraceae bacterium]|jgi:hypothetical protein|nr:peptidylprolyl isomerase [Oscillospiraceae bacterium]